ncbi:MAG: NADPH-dependent 2,4-dienoyl-CoA reductase [Betaproteobacteria bacterium]|nr:NADPH-dependent 2,4-dienoyl-CoA reductase [Betaproteobacteria bacterium]
METYRNLLSPLRVAGVELPNRMVMGAMHTRIEMLDRPYERLAAFYARRAEGEIGLIMTGGYSPTPEGVMDESGLVLDREEQLEAHRQVTSGIRKAGGRVALQILHAGRYAKLAGCVAPSALRARINAFTPRALATDEVWGLVESFARTAGLAREAGYAGVEIMGSEGYLINEFTSAITNLREDEFGGSFEARVRFPLEIVKAVRARAGGDFIVIFRISAMDLMEGGMTGAEVAGFARLIEAAGADIINTGIGWHEAAVPTIAAAVPRGAWVAAVRNVKQAVSIPVMASNRINTPDVAEEMIASGAADLVSMARPLLADPDFAKKLRLGLKAEINTCIACNQGCLDLIFTGKTATCLLNPRAGHELDFPSGLAETRKKIAVVGGGAAGMAFAVNAAERGHQVRLYEASQELGGQLNLAKKVPGKNEFNELLRYFKVMLEKLKVDIRLGAAVNVEELKAGNFDEIVVATGAVPRRPKIVGIDHPKVVDYAEFLSGRKTVGQTVAILGAGGIGFCVAETLVGDPAESLETEVFQKLWGVVSDASTPGGVLRAEEAGKAPRTVYMLQRRNEPFGKKLGKTTGWIQKARLKKAGVVMISGATYEAIDDEGLRYTVDGKACVLKVDHVVLCAGQVSERGIAAELQQAGLKVQLIGGAESAEDLDALRAIDQATRLAVRI